MNYKDNCIQVRIDYNEFTWITSIDLYSLVVGTTERGFQVESSLYIGRKRNSLAIDQANRIQPIRARQSKAGSGIRTIMSSSTISTLQKKYITSKSNIMATNSNQNRRPLQLVTLEEQDKIMYLLPLITLFPIQGQIARLWYLVHVAGPYSTKSPLLFYCLICSFCKHYFCIFNFECH